MATNKEILQKIFETVKPMVPEGGPQVTAEFNLVNDLGLDSMKVMEMLEVLEDSFDISIPINILPNIRTVKDLAEEIQKLIETE